MADAALLEVAEIVAGYGGVDILRGIDLTIAAGETVALLGSNGVGKTTLNKVLSGMLRPRSGTVTFEGRRLDRASPAAIVDMGLVHVPEGRRIFADMSVDENLTLGSYRRGKIHRSQNRERVMAIFPRLAERCRQRAGTLSGGEQQMLAIGRGLMAEPRFLILDEPSLGLSPLLVEEMFALVRRLSGEGLAILLVEQNVVQSLGVAARAYVLECGRIVLSGTGEALARDPNLQKTYLGM
ncbi:amino acid/amide ABC transporter ATP-binding protein 2, HAAT family [Rhizobiales bacterium GAS191]|jgi:branched-chain amino acid transport system ATP-binding protein|nr:amino acid/amide ABC transporter ATP-binding protein 2, HAAT family [Rhizobiales bacterium GAS113]SED68325.1 amino acid/amide ABC transporter ATP-binding protein 2, HAAT family [Rhizobiales bacterium GAS188]SEE83385.1 amino acid/amide ABC transporter ATP-binding protein 2, HAAT family [Rhizobiales bacterium GAS191]